MKHFTFAVPGDLDTPTGGYAYDRRVIAELRKLGWGVDVLNLGDGFPYPSTQTLNQAAKSLASLGTTPTIIDGLAFGILGDAARHMRAKPIALVHHPLALETGISSADTEKFAVSERYALRTTRAVIVPSPTTARTLNADYGVPKDHIIIAEPGVDRRAVSRGAEHSGTNLLSVGAISPRKGFDLLVNALADIRELDWKITIAGSLDRNPQCTAELRRQIEKAGLSDRILLTGSVSRNELDRLYDSADVFVLASHYEGYGMVFTEAIAAGLPIVASTGGAIPDTVPQGTGILVNPGDPDALAAALRQLIERPDLRLAMARNAEAAATHLPTWEDCAARISNLLDNLS